LTGAGIRLTGHNSSVEGNLVTTYATGILCDTTTGNYLASNRASNNTTDYNIAPGNTQGTGDLANVSY